MILAPSFSAMVTEALEAAGVIQTEKSLPFQEGMTGRSLVMDR